MLYVFLAVATVIVPGAFALGLVFGSKWECDRCARLAAQSFNEKNLSPTARRIYCSITSGHEELISEEKFFGKEK